MYLRFSSKSLEERKKREVNGRQGVSKKSTALPNTVGDGMRWHPTSVKKKIRAL
jgi:hypothetical protein